MPTITDSKKIDDLLTHGVFEVIDLNHLKKKLLLGKKLRVKLGIDPKFIGEKRKPNKENNILFRSFRIKKFRKIFQRKN